MKGRGIGRHGEWSIGGWVRMGVRGGGRRRRGPDVEEGELDAGGGEIVRWEAEGGGRS